MSKPIQVGDLVYVARPCPCGVGRGYMFTVERIEKEYNLGPYSKCGATDPETKGAMLAYAHIAYRHGYYPLSRLRRIKPLSELDSTDTREDLHEPA